MVSAASRHRKIAPNSISFPIRTSTGSWGREGWRRRRSRGGGGKEEEQRKGRGAEERRRSRGEEEDLCEVVAEGREGVGGVERAHALQPPEGGVHALGARGLQDVGEHLGEERRRGRRGRR